MYTLDELLAGWRSERLTAEQVIGQLLLHLGAVYERLRLMERRLGNGSPTQTVKETASEKE